MLSKIIDYINPSPVKSKPFTDSELIQIAFIIGKSGIPYKMTTGYSQTGQYLTARVRTLTNKYLMQFYHTIDNGIEYNKRILP